MNLFTGVDIKSFFPKHTAPCVRTFILLIQCILQSRTVCLYKCRDKALESINKKEINIDSSYARLIRFFKMKNVKDFITGIGLMMIRVAEIDLTYLVVDRTNWKRGSKNFNLLTIGNLKQDVFMPLYWIQLNKQGNSNSDERKTLIEELKNLIEKSGNTIKGSILLADREFIGQQWFEYLLSSQLSFVIRLKEKMYFELQTNTGKKNFIKIISASCREIWNLRYSHDARQYNLYFCDD